jgi:hypothetical protein
MIFGNQQEVVSRLHQLLAQEFGARYPENRSGSLTVSDIYYDLVPFQTCRAELGVDSILEYERALLCLLAGHGGLLEMETLAERQALERKIDYRYPDPGLLRAYLNSGVRISPPPAK